MDCTCSSFQNQVLSNWASEASPHTGVFNQDFMCHTKNTNAKNAWAKYKVTRTHMLLNKEEIVHFVVAAKS